MRLNEKAKESLQAAERLLDTADGEIEALMNAAASRAYHAADQAVVDCAIQADARWSLAQHTTDTTPFPIEHSSGAS
jgi:hypothetical protein